MDIDIDWASARIVEPENKKMVSLRLDTDVLAFFRKQGKGYQTRINAVLKAYKDAQEKHS
ncbi:MAG: BrnA antitoxin family protein [Rhodobacterales bacterium]|nr:BrnA antitoxin family protein [Rhodobacterales bacterium]